MASSTSLHSGAPSRCIISSSSKCRRTFLTTEANTEQLFSLAGNLSDDNGKMDPYRLSVWVSYLSIASGRKVFMPMAKAILERYMAKFSQGGTVDLADDFGLAPAPAPATE